MRTAAGRQRLFPRRGRRPVGCLLQLKVVDDVNLIEPNIFSIVFRMRTAAAASVCFRAVTYWPAIVRLADCCSKSWPTMSTLTHYIFFDNL
jgi:hypothetical protein